MTVVFGGSTAAAADPATRLFEAYGDQLYRFCLGRMRSREEAEDALQSTFLRAWKALEKGVVPDYEAAWLYKIAHNVCLSRRAVLARHGQSIPLHGHEDVEVTIAAPEARGDELIGLSDALAGLPANLRQAILLREWQGLSYAEIAEALGTTLSAVETLIFRARRDLAAALEAGGRKPKRSRLVDLGALLGRLFSLKAATGAALVAVGGAGIGTAVELAHHAPARPPAAALTTPIAAVEVARAPAETAPRAAVARPARAPRATPARVATRPVAPAPPAAAAAPAVPAAPAGQAVPAAPAVTTAAALPTPPPVEAPAVSVPAVAVPTVSLPQLPVDLGH